MRHSYSKEDSLFREQFETGIIQPADFSHRAHIRLAYIYLCEYDPETTHKKIRTDIQNFLGHHRMNASHYHETLTRSWILAVSYFMSTSSSTTSAADFITNNPILLDKEIMLTHYSKEILFSEKARTVFIKPNLKDIPNA